MSLTLRFDQLNDTDLVYVRPSVACVIDRTDSVSSRVNFDRCFRCVIRATGTRQVQLVLAGDGPGHSGHMEVQCVSNLGPQLVVPPGLT